MSRKTVLNVIGTLSSMLNTAKYWSYTCEQIDISKLALPKQGLKYEAPRFTLEQLRQILAAARDPWRTLFYILTLDGLRAGEVLGLKWVDSDPKLVKQCMVCRTNRKCPRCTSQVGAYQELPQQRLTAGRSSNIADYFMRM